jgi:hypothetical protein
MKLWSTGVSAYSTDVTWIDRAWHHLLKHHELHGTFEVDAVRARFDRYGMEWKGRAVAYLAADVRRQCG